MYISSCISEGVILKARELFSIHSTNQCRLWEKDDENFTLVEILTENISVEKCQKVLSCLHYNSISYILGYGFRSTKCRW